MQFPLFQMPFAGNGMTIGLDAVIHVLISHGIAIGLFSMIIIADWIDGITGQRFAEDWGRLARRMLKFTVVVTTTVGAITGAGIWFTTSALAPRGIASMLRIFFWIWFIEWIVFFLEVVAILVFYFLWDRLANRRPLRLKLGVLYVFFSLTTGLLITGVLGFMLTPGQWPTARNLLAAFFNPSYLPQLAVRFSLAFTVGSLIALAWSQFMRGSERFKAEAARVYGGVLALVIILFCVSLYIYGTSIPLFYRTQTVFSILTGRFSQQPWILYVGNLLGLALLLTLAVLAMMKRTRWARRLAIPGIVFFVAVVAQFERAREFIRGPYLMPGYMYVNGILLTERPLLAQTGILDNDYWFRANYPKHGVDSAGAYLFGQNCAVCHTIGGINDIKKRVAGRSEDGLYLLLGHTQDMVPFMPPFTGNDEERRLVAHFLYRLSTGQVRMQSHARFIPAPEGSRP